MRKVRDVTEDQCDWFTEDMAALDMEFARVLSRHRPLFESVWLGGGQDENNCECGPTRTTAAMKLLEEARSLALRASHEVAMYRAEGEA